MFTNKRLLIIFFGWLISCTVWLKSQWKWNSWSLLELFACLSTVNVCVLRLQIYRPDSQTFLDQIINFNPFLVKIHCFERNKDVLFKFISKEIFKLFIFSLKTSLLCKIYNLVCKILKRYVINLRRIEMYFTYQKAFSYKVFPCY